jgi:hypothetical protein
LFDRYLFDNDSYSPGQPPAHICSGDSGGPDFVRITMGGQEHRLLTGVHLLTSPGGTCVGGTAVSTAVTPYAKWIEDKLDGLYLSSMRGNFKYHDVTPVPVYRQTYTLEAQIAPFQSRSRRFKYHPQMHKIISMDPESYCFHVDADSPEVHDWVLLRPCNVRAGRHQQWLITEDHQIRYYGNQNLCVRMYNAGTLRLLGCNAASSARRWLFHAMPSASPPPL